MAEAGEQGAAIAFPQPASLCISSLSPEGKIEKIIVTVEGNDYAALREAADHQLVEVPLGDSPVMALEEVTYNRSEDERRAIRCFIEGTTNYPFVDLQDGEVVNRNSVHRFSLRFLHDKISPLPSSPIHLPYIYIRTKADFISSTPQRQMLAAPADALKDPSFVVLLRGLRSEGQLFWEHSDYQRFIKANSGQIFHFRNIHGGPKRFVFALLRVNDPVPCAQVPNGQCLMAYRRAGLNLWMQDGCVRCAEVPQPADINVWDRPRIPDDFQHAFTAAARM